MRVIAANHAPDHTTIARFRVRHEAALGALFGEVLALCAQAGIVEVEVVAIDGTKVHANASQHATPRLRANRARRSWREADASRSQPKTNTTASKRGDELPREFATAQGRRGWLREARSAASKRSAPRKPARSRLHARRGCNVSKVAGLEEEHRRRVPRERRL